MMTINKILVPTDFSEHSRESQVWAAELARKYAASLTLLHVYQPITYALPEGYVLPSANLLADLEVSMSKALEDARRHIEDQARLEVDTALLQGIPFAEIIRFSREGDYDLIVMSTHGRTGLRHALLGSVTEKVVRKAQCPVLTVRARNHEFERP